MSAFSRLDPNLRPWADALFEVARTYGLRPRVLSTFRSFSQQERLYRDWISGRRTTPAAPPGRSLHNFGHAFDLKTNHADSQEWLGQVWEAWGGRWGGRFNDPNHFDTGASIS